MSESHFIHGQEWRARNDEEINSTPEQNGWISILGRVNTRIEYLHLLLKEHLEEGNLQNLPP